MEATDPRSGAGSWTILASLRSGGARRWFFGGLVGLVWLINTGFDVYGRYPDASSRALFTVLLVLYAVVFLAIPPLNWVLPTRYRLLAPTGLWVLSLVLLPWLDWGVYSVWAYVGVAAAMSLVPFRAMVAYVAGIAIVTAVLAWLAGRDGDSIFLSAAIIASVSLMMAAFARTITSMNQLRATQHEMARLAVEQERSRVARDLHDILGHSLTVITVKAELAGRLIEADPARATREITEVEELARGALADVRATVAGYRGVSIASELANARSALESAGIAATLPGTVDIVPADFRELFGWVVREGVTNVVRHSRAAHCTIQLGRSFVEVIDDGRGGGEGTGTGLTGLAERVTAAGLVMSAGPVPSGGFRLRVSA